MDTAKMIERAISKGALQGTNPTDAKVLLNELIDLHSEMNLPVALAYYGFISDYMAEKMQMALYD